MLPLIIAGLVVFSVIAVVAIVNGPTQENETLNDIRERLRREERLAELERANMQRQRELDELRAKMREEERKRVLELARQKEAEMVRVARENARIRAERIAAERRKQEQEARRAEVRRSQEQAQQTQEDDNRRKREEKAKRAEERQKREQELKKQEDERRRVQAEEKRMEEQKQKKLEKQIEELKRREQQLQDGVDEAHRISQQVLAAQLDAEQGHGPIRWPTRDEVQHALQSTGYSASNFHFAIVGRAGSGKSSLINAFRNLGNQDPGAAKTGTKETTLEIGRYPDPGDQPPRRWIVWFDVPGAGTHRVSHHDYFIKQQLYVFDLIILAIGDRFEEIDSNIVENCARFKIPVFIVRSKANMHILNSMEDYGFDRIEESKRCYEYCREQFIQDTNTTVEEELTRQGLAMQPVYIVSRDVLRRTYHASLHTSQWEAVFTKPEKTLIHECSLVQDLLTAAAKRRCEPSVEQVGIMIPIFTFSRS